jgi:hypothetical protein
MNERPILFSAPMVRAILASQKTQTRRVMTKQPHGDTTVHVERFHQAVVDRHGDEQPGPEVFGAWWDDGESGLKCPFGGPGDRLWVRETHAIVPRTAYRCSEGVQQVLRPDDDHDAAIFREGFDRSFGGIRWRPSIHMPRWASRITLEITDVRVERLHEISEVDARAEGVETWAAGAMSPDGQRDYSAVGKFQMLWSSINGIDSWHANPCVWVITFERVEVNHA